MHTGLLWFDNSNSLLSVKIQKAYDYYIKKYGRIPDLVLVHPSMLESNDRDGFHMESLRVRAYRPVLPGHIWIGIEDKE